MNTHISLKATLAFCTLLIISGCVSPVFDLPVENPTPSELKYVDVNSKNTKIAYNNLREENEVLGSGPLLTFNLKQDDAPINEITYLISNTEKELKNRGVDVSFVEKDDLSTDANVKINSLKMVNHRANGFSPLVTLTSISADVEYKGNTHRIVSFVKRGKVPIWTLTEDAIKEDVFNQPLSILVKDFASGINQSIFGYKVSDTAVKKLADKVELAMSTNTADYQDIYQLGFSNNAIILPTLLKGLDSVDEYVRLASISSLGILKVEDQMQRLIEIYTSSKLWQDRGMALKSIGNLGTEESKKFLQDEYNKIEAIASPNKEQVWNKEIIKLFM